MNIPGFQQKKVLGEGAYGKVYKALRMSDNKIYAVKVIDLNKLSFREVEDAVNEIRIMASMTSPFILSFYEAFCDDTKKKLCIVTEYAQLGDLSHLIERRKRKSRPLQESQIWRFLLEILEGLRILHSCGVVHRDLKSANILLSGPDLVKIGDLGISTVLHKQKQMQSKEMARTQIGTPLYLAPEVWKNRPYDQKCDMWSLGVLLYEMMTFNFPFLGRNQDELARRVCAGAYTIPKSVEKMYSIELQSILRKLLVVNPNDRPSVDELFNIQSVKCHMDLLNAFLQPELYKVSSQTGITSEGGNGNLLSTIHVPVSNYNIYGQKNANLGNVHLPSQKYNKRPPVVKPMAERLHMKRGIPVPRQLDLAAISTPDLTLITDQDWWSPNKDIKPSYESTDANNMQQNTNNTYPPSTSYAPNPINLQYNSPIHQPQVQFIQQPQKNLFQPRPYNNEKEVYFVEKDPDSPRKQPQVINQPKVSPRSIPSRYKNMHRQIHNSHEKEYQDPRWKRRQASPLDQKANPVICDDQVWKNNVNNRYNQPKQQEVPWWFGQEAQPQPMQPLIAQRKHPVVAINPRFRRIGKN